MSENNPIMETLQQQVAAPAAPVMSAPAPAAAPTSVPVQNESLTLNQSIEDFNKVVSCLNNVLNWSN